MKKFDIKIHTAKGVLTENGVPYSDAAGLKKFYENNGVKIEIINEYEDDGVDGTANPIPPPTTDPRMVDNRGLTMGMNTYGLDFSKLPELLKVAPKPSRSNIAQKTNTENSSVNTENVKVQTEKTIVTDEKKTEISKPKFFKVGNIECKVENGKVFQKQWMRVSDVEMMDFRIVSDKNNKIVPLKDKHIEMLKWVCTEENNEAV